MEANVWFTNASLVVDTRLAFPEKKKKKKKREKSIGTTKCWLKESLHVFVQIVFNGC
jgi:hypothetical protein